MNIETFQCYQIAVGCDVRGNFIDYKFRSLSKSCADGRKLRKEFSQKYTSICFSGRQQQTSVCPVPDVLVSNRQPR